MLPLLFEYLESWTIKVLGSQTILGSADLTNFQPHKLNGNDFNLRGILLIRITLESIDLDILVEEGIYWNTEKAQESVHKKIKNIIIPRKRRMMLKKPKKIRKPWFLRVFSRLRFPTPGHDGHRLRIRGGLSKSEDPQKAEDHFERSTTTTIQVGFREELQALSKGWFWRIL